MNPFEKILLRAPEDEGAGGVPNDRVAALENRLSEMGEAFSGFLKEQKRAADATVQSQFERAETDIKTAVDAAAAKVDAAEKALGEAFDSGDGPTIAKAQRVMSEAAAARERINGEAHVARQRIAAAKKAASEGPKPGAGGDVSTENLDKWKTKHGEWYGIDAEMTKAAHAIDRQIQDAGVLKVGSKEYYDAIDREMSRRYPDRLSGSPPGTSVNRNGGGDGGGAKGETRIDAGLVSSYERMGFDMKDPKMVQKLVEARQHAVNRGILPEKPVLGRVLTR